jgi:hypothetical protein
VFGSTVTAIRGEGKQEEGSLLPLVEISSFPVTN